MQSLRDVNVLDVHPCVPVPCPVRSPRERTVHASPSMHSHSCVALVMVDQSAPNLVGPTSPLYGFSSIVTTYPPSHMVARGSRTGPLSPSNPLRSKGATRITSEDSNRHSESKQGGEHDAPQRPPTMNAPSGPPHWAASPKYTAYMQPQRPDAPPRSSAYDHQQHNGYRHAQMS